jgi:anti-sigma factor RsiW
MTCEELLQALNDYVDGAQLADVCEEFAEHLAGCNPCQVVVDNIRHTITLYQAGQPYSMPTEFQQRLQASLQAQWEAKFPNARQQSDENSIGTP